MMNTRFFTKENGRGKKAGKGKYKLSKEEYYRMTEILDDTKGEISTENIKVTPHLTELMQWPKRDSANMAIREQEDLEAKLEAEHYLARAKQMQLEQEDNVKVANKIILATKCQAIRDAQIAEKQRIISEQATEEKRLETEMEAVRSVALAKYKERNEVQLQKRVRYVSELVQQMTENEEMKRQQRNMAMKEGRKLHELQEQQAREEAEAVALKTAEQQRVMHELVEMNKAIQHRRVIEQAHEKMANHRIQQYMAGKVVREAEREKRRRRLRQAQERETARLRAIQQRQQEIRDAAFNESVERDQEFVAREWRAKELAALRRRADMDKELQEARAKQAAERERLQALELQREQDHSITIKKMHEEAAARELLEQEKKEKALTRYREELQRQIAEKQETKRHARLVQVEEASRDQGVRNEHLNDLQGVLQLKVRDLRSSKVPEKYIFGVERRLQHLHMKE